MSTKPTVESVLAVFAHPEAIRRHQSQVARVAGLEERMASWNRALGRKASCAYAEAFKVLRPHCDICR